VKARAARIPRFDGVERAVHWCNATLFLVLLATGASLYLPDLSTIVAHRHAVKTIHVYAGLLLPIPLLIGLLLPAGRQLRADVGRFNRWTDDDRRWWSRRTRDSAQLGKFNPGQKLNAIFIGAAIVLMLMTGSIMRWFKPFPDSWRTGATFVHDWVFIALVVVIAGHIMFALADGDSLRSMVRGWVPETWARRHRPRWWAEVVAARAGVDGSADATRDVEAGRDERVGEARVGAGEVAVGDGMDGRAGDRFGEDELQ
jgi:formate dehydrogenase subunit gamma